MTVPKTGATSHTPDWNAVNWRAANKMVRRLQARIVKATQASKWHKVKALQHLLTHSYSGKVLAVRRVTENQGKNTPGIDGETFDTPEKKAQAVQQLRRRGYQPQPLRRVHIPKRNGKTRPLGIPTMHDRAMQALYLLALEPVAETTADPNSYGFRRARSVADAVEQCFVVLAKRASPQWILEADIKSCFDTISHAWLLDHIPMDKIVLRKWLKAGYLEGSTVHPTEEGTPQGGIISPVLANLTLDGLERKLLELYPKGSYRARKTKSRINVIRYADDFIVTGGTKELLEREVKPVIEQFLKERGLALSQEKTRLTHIDNGFDFLGHHFRKYRGKLLVKPSKTNVKRFLCELRDIIKKNKTERAISLITQLNPKVRGWTNFYRHVVSATTFSQVDRALFESLWRWAKRRHPNKNLHWCRSKYFGRVGERNWVFVGTALEDQQPKQVYLLSAAKTPITRHLKIKGEANPFDPAWESYFEARLAREMTLMLRGKRSLLGLWQEQRGLCPRCQQTITSLTGWHSHHITWRSHGGSDGLENRVLLHPTCHQQVHSRNLSVAKPRPVKGVMKA
jgi:RNA-directed DNA polymerase